MYYCKKSYNANSDLFHCEISDRYYHKFILYIIQQYDIQYTALQFTIYKTQKSPKLPYF
jgi:hypothetical protein